MNETELARRGIAATESFFRSLGMPVSFKDFDLPGDGIERMWTTSISTGRTPPSGPLPP